MRDFTIGQKVYQLSGLDVVEVEVYALDDTDRPWVRPAFGLKRRFERDSRELLMSLDEAVAASGKLRERLIANALRSVQRMALNPNVKVRLLKGKK